MHNANHDDRQDDDVPGAASGHSRQLFAFDITDGQVTGAYKVRDGQRVWDPVSPNESYTLDGSDVLRTEVKPFGTEITRYSDADGDGFYQRTSEQWLTEPTHNHAIPMPVITQALRFEGTSGDDLIAVQGGDDSLGGAGRDAFVVRDAAHLRIDDFSLAEGDLLVFDLGLGLHSLEHLASFVTDLSYTDGNIRIEFGNDVSITLVGVSIEQMGADDIVVLS